MSVKGEISFQPALSPEKNKKSAKLHYDSRALLHFCT
jgi:hypothetical protein